MYILPLVSPINSRRDTLIGTWENLISDRERGVDNVSDTVVQQKRKDKRSFCGADKIIVFLSYLMLKVKSRKLPGT